MSAIAELTPKKKAGRGRTSLSLGSQGDHVETENLFQPSKQYAVCVYSFFSPSPAFASPLACLSCIYFSQYPLTGELARRLEHDVCVCELQAVS